MSDFPTYRQVVQTVISQVISNHLFEIADENVQECVRNEINQSLCILLKNVEFYSKFDFNSYSILVDVQILLDKDDPFFIKYSFDW